MPSASVTGIFTCAPAAAGWGAAKTDYAAIFQAENFHVFVPGFADDFISALDISHLYMALLILSLVAAPAVDCWLSRRGTLGGFSERAPSYLTA